jgi:imidazolonepropionase-like amidohydrolase
VVVANGAEAVAEALAAGCDAIEQGYAMGEDNLRTMAERGVVWIPSLVRAKNGVDGASGGGDIACRFSQRYVAPGKPVPGAEALWRKTLAGQLAQLRLARSLGVVTTLGSGAGNCGLLHGESLIEEMKLFVKGGYPLAEIFHAASEVAARFFAMNRLGRLAVGRPATFLIVRGSLQQLPRKLFFLEGIFVDGAPCPYYRKNPVKVVAGKG